MTDTEVKDLFERVLAEPGPPLASGAQVLGAARRTARRRRAGAAVACSALAAVAVAGAAVGVPALSGALTPTGGHAGTGGSGPASASPSPSTSTSPGDTARLGLPATPQGKADMMLATLVGAVPAGYTTPTTDTVKDSSGQAYQARGTQVLQASRTGQNNGQGWYLTANTDVYQGGQAGSIAVSVSDQSEPPGDGDVCQRSAEHQGTEQSCQTIMVNGIRVRVAMRDIGAAGRYWYATVYRDGWTTQVQEGQHGMRPGSAMLATLPYTPQQLAQLAMNPAFQFQP